MTPSAPRLRVLSVGGNAVSAFLSWRLQATNACDVTLVWKANYQAVAQYGISFKSKLFGNERFRPRHVVQTPEDAAGREAAYDYVLLCVKALPDVYNLADIIQSVVKPQHTCILVNTTNTLGVEKQLEERFPTNVVLSLVSAAGLAQLGSSEFEHSGSTEIWVGPSNLESRIPQSIQRDMSEALAMTLTTGQVDCKVSDNIRQQQYERMIGPIAFHPASIIFEISSLKELIQKPGVRELVSEIMEELLQIAVKQRCSFEADFKQKLIESMVQTSEISTMYEDFTARRPMEVETYLGTPSKLAQEAGIKTPRIDTLYTILRQINTVNKDRPAAQAVPATNGVNPAHSVAPPQAIGRMNSGPPGRPANGPMNGNGRPMPPRGPPNGMGAPPPGRRGPWPPNANRGPAAGFPPRGSSSLGRQPSFEGDNLDEFSHVVLYDSMPDGEIPYAYGENGGASNAQILREKELMLRERELAIRQQERALRGRGPRRPSHAKHQDFDDDDDDDDDLIDPAYGRGPAMAPIDPDSFDMMSVTSRRTKRAPSQTQLRKDMFNGGSGMRAGGYGRPPMGRHRTSAQLMSDMPALGENIMNNPMIGFSSNRYGTVDRKEMADESRANSLTASRLHEMGGAGGPYPQPVRRTSRSPGHPLGPGPGSAPGPMGRGSARPGGPNEPFTQGRNGRPSPPGGMSAPVAKYPMGQGMMMQPAHQIEQQVGVSKPYPRTGPTKSLTGSASASAGSGDSGSANIESEPSAHSSTSSFAPRTMIHA